MAGISAPFGSVQEADSAYYGDGGGGGGGDGGDGSGATWGDLQEGASLGSGWVLAYQDQQNGDRRRWFVIRMASGSLQALKSNGEPESAGENTTLSELPHYSNEDDARAAYQAWAEENGGTDEQGDESNEWGNWSKVSEESPWHIYSRSHQTEDRAQFLATSTLGDGTTVYLASGGEVSDEAQVFDSADALSSALQAYFQRAENGDVPEGRRPTGDDPGTETIRREASRVNTSSSSEKVQRLVEKMGGQKVVLAGLAVGGFAVYQSQKDGGS
ncbi:head protein [Haloarcula californiae icosahedral virus 1]|uniref:VP5 n=1 Tax=Haloarcula californiae icosahedral virus 1 TaxID=1735722 RepID=A0A1B0TFE9_9VIRU|nr:head protein [Haloarcula californiae icosahedral virus 1]ALJ99688.1 VP5 [Haloarcula californiae icosahedral virus 1]